MTRTDLIEHLGSWFPALTPKDVELAVKTIQSAMIAQLQAGERIGIRGFGSFVLSYRPPRTERNPKTGAFVAVKAKYVPHFKAGKDLRELVSRPEPMPLSAETVRTNPFDYVQETVFAGLPVAYPEDQAALLKPHRETSEDRAEVAALADELAAAAHFKPLAFVWILNRYLHQKFEREIREEAGVQAPPLTLRRRRGACRDLAPLFVAVCRQKRIACRFVSGYQARSEREGDQRFPHAWAEAYVPGGGWRGYDPSHGLALADGHVAIAAACSAWKRLRSSKVPFTA